MNTNPSFNLNVVVRETGIKPDTLRAWERRYGLPNPSRTEGGHRLYSERDIATIHWLIERQEEGLRIKHAVDLWREIKSTDQDPLLVKPTGQISPFRGPNILDQTSPALDELRRDWVNASINFNETEAENIANFAFALNHAETVLFEVLIPGLADIGDFWYRNKASVQQEHFATSLILRRLNSLIAASPVPHKNGTILVGCPPGEDHTISPLTITFMLRQRGWRAIYLGANVPKDKLSETITSIKPNTIIMTAQHIESAISLLEIAIQLEESKIQLGFGGKIFVRNPNLHAKFPGYFLGNNLKNAASRIEDFIIKPLTKPKKFEIIVENQVAWKHFLENQAEIEYELNKNLPTDFISPENLKVVNRFLITNIQAFLQFGEIEIFKNEILWTKEYLFNQNFEPEMVQIYLDIFYKVTKQILNEHGKPIIDLLSIFIYNQGAEQ